jgi:hypothetical protein
MAAAAVMHADAAAVGPKDVRMSSVALHYPFSVSHAYLPTQGPSTNISALLGAHGVPAPLPDDSTVETRLYALSSVLFYTGQMD